jgi:hypothetical protein
MVQPQAAIPRSVAVLVVISPKRFSLGFPFVPRFGWVGVSAPGEYLRPERTLNAERITMTDLEGISASARIADFIPARLPMGR